MAGPHTPRARARAQMLTEIRQRALRQLSDEGAANLSLRAIARDLDLVSSAIYRYYPNRDALLTALIVEAYEDLALTVAEADAAVDPAAHRERWILRCRSFRAWARSEPARFQLIYGSPVPGYRAPGDTIAPAAAVIVALFAVLAEAAAAGDLDDRQAVRPTSLQPQLEAVAAGLELELPAAAMVRAVGALAELIGLLTLELGGHFVGGFEPADDVFEACVAELADRLGLPD